MDLSSYLEEVDYASPCKEYNISKKKQVGNWDIILPLTKLSKLFDLNLIWKVELQKIYWNVSSHVEDSWVLIRRICLEQFI